ncbi:MAG: serine hydrolase [Pseudonocardiales bacterium]|nr:MAG: serine hydrolase [Pseudonocardiales bacterium]
MTSTDAAVDTARTIADTFERAGARGYLHARRVGGPGALGLDADEPVVLASVFKIAVALGYARCVAEGRLDPRARTTIGRGDRVGGIGTAGCADDVQMSWRDVARFMLTMSDNAATDVVLRQVGLDAVHRALAELGLHRTRLIGGCAEILATMTDELGYDGIADLERDLAGVDAARVWALAALDPVRTTASTPSEMTSLLDAIWQDRAAAPAACAEVRAIMAAQIWPHRLTAGFPDAVRVAAKTGTLPGIRKQVGVVEYPDGARYAIAVFTRARELVERQPAIDAAIGATARIAVEHLRAT